MGLFSEHAFLLGVLMFLVTGITTIIYAWLCLMWDIRILEITFFNGGKKKLFAKEINGIKMSIGYLPLHSSLLPFGPNKHDILENNIVDDDLKFTLYHQSKIKQNIFWITGNIVLVAFFIICVCSLSTDQRPLIPLFLQLETFAIKFLLMTLHANQSRADIITLYRTQFLQLPTVMFAVIMFLNYYFLYIPFNKLMFILVVRKLPKAIKVCGWLLVIFMLLFLLALAPFTVLTFFTIFNAIRYLVWCLAGMFIAGTILFFLLVLVLKSY